MIAEIDNLPEKLRKRKLKNLSCHLRHAFYLGSYIDKEGRIVDVFNAREQLKKLGLCKDKVAIITIGDPREPFEEEDLTETMKAYEEDFEGSYQVYDDEDVEAMEEGE